MSRIMPCTSVPTGYVLMTTRLSQMEDLSTASMWKPMGDVDVSPQPGAGSLDTFLRQPANSLRPFSWMMIVWEARGT